MDLRTDGDGDGDGDGDDSRAPSPSVTRAYISSEGVIAREVAAVARDIEGTPGYWRPFALRHSAVGGLLVGVVAVAGWRAGAPAEAMASVLVFCLVVVAVVTALDLALARRRLRRAIRLHHWHGCPPGTVVRATWSASRVVFALPMYEISVALADVTAARHLPGVLFLDQPDQPRAWTVPDELVGDEVLALLRAALGPRYGRD